MTSKRAKQLVVQYFTTKAYEQNVHGQLAQLAAELPEKTKQTKNSIGYSYLQIIANK